MRTYDPWMDAQVNEWVATYVVSACFSPERATNKATSLMRLTSLSFSLSIEGHSVSSAARCIHKLTFKFK